MTEPTDDVPHTRVSAVDFFSTYVQTNRDLLKGKAVYDVSAGSGYIANLFLEAGAKVHLFDLFPSQNKFCPEACHVIDLQKEFPLETGIADYVICAETIEHLPDQHFFFKETARILKTGGTLILTTPNPSSLRSRLSQFLMESEHYSTPAPNELNVWTQWPGSTDGYFGKLFVSGVLRLRTLAAINKLSVYKIHPTKKSSTSFFLLIFYPLIYFFGKKNLRRQVATDPSNKTVYQSIFETNTSMQILTGKHLIMEFRKV